LKTGALRSLFPNKEMGYRSARANVGVREGEWYIEFKILKGNDDSGAHVRLGFARREASLEAPVGHDAYGYGVRDVTGEKVHISRPSSFMKEGFKTGDVIGMHISIPRSEERKLFPSEVHRDRIPIRYKGQLYFESLDYVPTKAMGDLLLPLNVFKKKQNAERYTPEKIPGSYIRIYKNGRDMGIAFENLNEFLPPHSKFQMNLSQAEADDGQLGYYPVISVFRGGKAEFNFGPGFEFPPYGLHHVRPMSERYDEQVADDIVFDLIDQLDYEITDRLEDEALARIKVSNATSQAPTPQPAVVAKVEEIADSNDTSESLADKLHEQQKQLEVNKPGALENGDAPDDEQTLQNGDGPAPETRSSMSLDSILGPTQNDTSIPNSQVVESNKMDTSE
jgi:COMPASS component BRE2